jgi:hypothetical protein
VSANIYRAGSMREAEGEAEEEEETDLGREAAEPLPPQEPKSESRPSAAQAPQIVASPGANRPRVVVPAEPHEERPGANFGRFQGLR